MAIGFTKGDQPGQQKVLLACDAPVDQQQLVASLGKHADQYVVKGVAEE